MAEFRPLVAHRSTGSDGFRPLPYARVGAGGLGFAPLSDRKAAATPPRRSVPAAPVPTAPIEAAPPPPRVPEIDIARIREEAFQAGRAAALREQGQSHQQELARLTAVRQEIEAIRDGVFARSVQDAAEAVVLIAWQILRRELTVPGHQVETLVRSVMADLRSSDDIFVRVSAEDEATLRAALPALNDELGSQTKLRIEAHPSISPGGVIVETTWGRVDATVETQMQAFAETVEAWATATIENYGTEG